MKCRGKRRCHGAHGGANSLPESTMPGELPQQTGYRRIPCARCQRPLPVCLCSALPNQPGLPNRTRVVILRHPKEAKRKVVTTAPLVELCLRDCQIVTGTQLPLDDAGVVDVATGDGRRWLLLYPGDGAVPVGELDNSVPSTLFVLDGTWKQVRYPLDSVPGSCRRHVPPTLRISVACTRSFAYRHASCTTPTPPSSAAAPKSHCQSAARRRPGLQSLSGCSPATISSPPLRASRWRCSAWSQQQQQQQQQQEVLTATQKALAARPFLRRSYKCSSA